ncbi:hypothetical protein [Cellulomonas sp. HZM]|uniref:hypothetical protein n=1 Tax=Cellulomonas sp. HZM TaxID=1454010 RepID=UPI0004930093|nr:hypothetical protein [Cellulomonas sp. HZM]
MTTTVPCPNCDRALDVLLGETVCSVCVSDLRRLLEGVASERVPAPLVTVRTADGSLVQRRAIDGGRLVPGLAMALEAAIRGELRHGTSVRSGSVVDARLPLVATAVYQRDELVRTLASAAAAVASARGLDRPERRLVPLAAWWLQHLAGLQYRDDGPALVQQMSTALRSARAVLEHRLDRRVFRGRCDAVTESGEACGGALYVVPPAATVTCPLCGTEYPADERRLALLRAARASLVTATEAARALQGLGVAVEPATIRKWVQRDLLHPRAHTPAPGNKPLYRLGDVEQLVRRAAVPAALRHAAIRPRSPGA